jgi:hypothetical protein
MTHEDEIEELRTEIAEQDAVEQRLERLERDNAALHAANVSLTAKIAAIGERGSRKVLPPPRPAEEGAKVSYPITPSSFTMPSGAELGRLRKIVGQCYPQLMDSSGLAQWHRYVTAEENEAAYVEEFRQSILSLGGMRMLPKPDTRTCWTTHRDRCRDFLLSRTGKSSDLRMAPFITAALALRFPVSGLFVAAQSISLGIAEYSGITVSADQWRETLKTGSLRPMFGVALPLRPASPVRIVGEGY